MLISPSTSRHEKSHTEALEWLGNVRTLRKRCTAFETAAMSFLIRGVTADPLHNGPDVDGICFIDLLQ